MKRILLSVFILLSILQARASDTLTIRQVYNFSVGDTFDYLSTYKYLDVGDDISCTYYGQTYSRYIINSKTLSTDSSTVTYTRHQVYPIDRFDTLAYTNMDSNVFQFFTNQFSHLPDVFDTSHLPDGRIVDSLSVNESFADPFSSIDSLRSMHSCKYADGLGLTYSLYDTIGDGGTMLTSDTTLIYYSKGTDSWGTTYYQYIGDRLPHYTPVPEECAYWNYILTCPGQCTVNYTDNTLQQVYTGSHVNFNNHIYVQLILRSLSPVIEDSVFGYFRNDTVGQKLYFTNSMTSPEVLLFDFTVHTSDNALGNNFLYLDTTVTVGIKRIIWYDYPQSFGTALEYIEGIGSVYGFPGQGSKNVSYYNQFYQETDPCTEIPFLQSFCVCGQTIYSYNGVTSGTCFPLMITKTPDIQQVSLYPNPTSDLLNLSFSDVSQSNTQFILTDILGQEVYSSPVTQSETIHDISKLASGIYTWRVVENNTIIKTGKVVKE